MTVYDVRLEEVELFDEGRGSRFDGEIPVFALKDRFTPSFKPVYKVFAAGVAERSLI